MCHTPGTAASAATAIDGYELTKKGRGLEAVGVSTLASMIGGVVGALALLFIAPPLGRFSLRFAALEYFLVAAFGITIIGTLAGDQYGQRPGFRRFGPVAGLLGLRRPDGRAPGLPLASWRWRTASAPSGHDRPVLRVPGDDAGL